MVTFQLFWTFGQLAARFQIAKKRRTYVTVSERQFAIGDSST